jgi:hypothetical protein
LLDFSRILVLILLGYSKWILEKQTIPPLFLYIYVFLTTEMMIKYTINDCKLQNTMCGYSSVSLLKQNTSVGIKVNEYFNTDFKRSKWDHVMKAGLINSSSQDMTDIWTLCVIPIFLNDMYKCFIFHYIFLQTFHVCSSVLYLPSERGTYFKRYLKIFIYENAGWQHKFFFSILLWIYFMIFNSISLKIQRNYWK